MMTVSPFLAMFAASEEFIHVFAKTQDIEVIKGQIWFMYLSHLHVRSPSLGLGRGGAVLCYMPTPLPPSCHREPYGT